MTDIYSKIKANHFTYLGTILDRNKKYKGTGLYENQWQ
jgi:hypothetical protein